MRSNFLVHWTGKDIAADPGELDGNGRQLFVDRLRETLATGFWMTMPPEELVRGTPEGTVTGVAYKTPMTCFTEVKLSDSKRHSQEYGLLGIGVDRRFVLDRMGGPVHYVRNNHPEYLVNNHLWLSEWIQRVPESVADVAIARDIFPMLLAMLKGMSRRGSDDFVHLDEHEWRIVFLHGNLVDEGKIVRTGHETPEFKVPILPEELRFLVFPDAATRDLARSDATVMAYLEKAACPQLTIDECLQF